nr:phage tail protein [Sphingomonas ginsenosidivorax]
MERRRARRHHPHRDLPAAAGRQLRLALQDPLLRAVAPHRRRRADAGNARSRYTASIWVQDFAGSVNNLLVPLLLWIAGNQSDLFEKADRKPFTFESELLDAETCDITISIDLTELVRVEQLPNGLKVTNLPEPDMLDVFPCVPKGTILWTGLIEDPASAIEIVTHDE